MKRVFRDPPTLETRRLTLRKLKKSDWPDVFDYARDPEVTKYLTWSSYNDERDAVKFLAYVLPRYKSGDYCDWAVVERATGRMIGTCGFTSFNFEANSAEVGYVLNRKRWGEEIAPEALRAVLRFGFTYLDLHRIEAHYIVGNEKSLRVMQKVGMKYEGILRDFMYVKGDYVSVGVAAILANEFGR
ncbi:MAG: GNAT family N-acetyltransferase [Clostridia bacterium]|nr:GNAT family N-acetyltransferase [Clostridia bacterium]